MKTEMLKKLRTKADDLGVRNIANLLLDDPRFPLWSGSAHAAQHHYGTGGLIIHVSEVVDMCLFMRERYYPDVDETVLFLSALLHDWGKLWDFEPYDPNDADRNVQEISQITSENGSSWGSSWQGTVHKRNIHHISRSAIEWAKAVALSGECKGIEDQVAHAILAHHGQREWGSPVAPNTHVAWLLYCCDVISARMNDCTKMDYVRFRKETK